MIRPKSRPTPDLQNRETTKSQLEQNIDKFKIPKYKISIGQISTGQMLLIFYYEITPY
jgi:hypothetical protein